MRGPVDPDTLLAVVLCHLNQVYPTVAPPSRNFPRFPLTPPPSGVHCKQVTVASSTPSLGRRAT